MSIEKLDRLKTVLGTYGADPARWPDADRQELAAFVNDRGELEVERQNAGQLDLILSAASVPAPPAGARSALLDVVRTTVQTEAQEQQSEPARRFWVGNFAAASTLAASLLIGIYVGSLESLDRILLTDSDAGIWFEVNGTDDPLGLEGGDEDNAGSDG